MVGVQVTTVGVIDNLIAKWLPWSSGNGRRLVIQRLRVRILELDTGWTFLH